VTTFRQAPPGQRFQGRYWHHRDPRHRRPVIVRLASLTIAVVLAIVGVLMLVLPGPGILVLALSGALFASESLTIARMLDSVELRGRAAWRRIQAWRNRDRTRS
jgi:fatty acid desaturase